MKTILTTKNGYAQVLLNAFKGANPHELSITITSGAIGDIRRFAVPNIEAARLRAHSILMNN